MSPKSATCLLPLAFLLPTAAAAQTDLDRYLAEVRAQGMTEKARGDLRTVANILTGATLFSFQHTGDGEYELSYGPGFCPKPGMDRDEIRRIREGMEQRAEAELQRLRSLADQDGSGFVSSEEGKELHDLVLFALQVSKLEPGDRTNAAAVGKALGREPDWVRSQTAKYGELRSRFYKARPDAAPAALPALAL